ncbi:NAD(+)/NADH kinase [Thiovibrio frasassiensis]|uniref:NAD kinase n=1 Tax=Thiovibrio frasassiensis TaxID=2984131 RepID=A0A9X4MFC3_9BACT|nr:NAD(+)/NADH kinase [Thiovibrio frasassiensis]MDG4476504.1 NAD(+)/NADH kinase [Thiovibrio frasassiensis]
MNIRKVGIICRKDSPAALAMSRELLSWLGERSIAAEVDTIVDGMDLLIILGGDGTLLHVAEQASRLEVPVVGVNLGDLGFLTEVAVSERYEVLEGILAGEMVIEERLMLKARIRRANETSGWRHALNDVVVSKGSADQLVQLSTWADQKYITTYRADGLIFSTPTGSTAYNLSAGGPIVNPALQSILVTPICPFMLESRPVLLPAAVCLTTRLAEQGNEVKVIVDGQPAWEMSPGETLEVVASERPLRLICSPQKDYFEILRNKLNWGGRAGEARKHPL